MQKTALKALSLIVTAVIFAGCKGSGGSSQRNIGGGSAPTPEAMGIFTEEASSTDLDGGYDNCPSSGHNLDPRIKEGQVYKIESKWLSTSGTYIGGVESVEVQSIDAHNSKYTTKRTFPGPNGDQVWIVQSCTVDTANYSYSTECGIESVSPNLQSAINNSSGEVVWRQAACNLYDESKEESYSLKKGTYTLANGKTLTAYREESVRTGEISCRDENSNRVVKGNGKITSITIKSEEVGEVHTFLSCGSPSAVFKYEKAELDDGKVLAHEKFEIQDGKF